jgi:hypothetical protein
MIKDLPSIVVRFSRRELKNRHYRSWPAGFSASDGCEFSDSHDEGAGDGRPARRFDERRAAKKMATHRVPKTLYYKCLRLTLVALTIPRRTKQAEEN